MSQFQGNEKFTCDIEKSDFHMTERFVFETENFALIENGKDFCDLFKTDFTGEAGKFLWHDKSYYENDEN